MHHNKSCYIIPWTFRIDSIHPWSSDVSKPNQDAIDENIYGFSEQDEEVLRDEDIPKFEKAMMHNQYKAAPAFVLMLSMGIRSEELFALQIGKDYVISMIYIERQGGGLMFAGIRSYRITH